MTVDALERLRAADPLPEGGTAPPIEAVLRRIADEVDRRPAGRRWGAALIPVIAVAAAAAVVGVVLVSASRHNSAPAPTTAPPTPSGMRGTVFGYSLGFAAPRHMVISFTQCDPCRAQPTGAARTSDWLAVTSDGGAKWRVSRAETWVFDPQFSGADGWAQGTLDTPRAHHLAAFFVTHDSGRTWQPAQTAAPSPGDGRVSIAGGEVWSFGEGCTKVRCQATVLHGPASGDRLTATSGQPIHGDDLNLQVVAAAPGTAYLLDPRSPVRAYVTRDDGRSWQRVEVPCSRPGLLSATDARTLWTVCGRTVRRSIDGGRSWSTSAGLAGSFASLEPASGTVAWLLTGRGQVLRSTDGGTSWSMVHGSLGPSPVLVERGPQAAAVLQEVVIHGRLTHFVILRTVDGGRTWQSRPVPLPGGNS